jgi:hypothetical protein
LYIEGSGTTLTTFSQCTASPLGGAIYLELESGTEDYFNLSGASYSDDNNALYGKSLFVNAKGDL